MAEPDETQAFRAGIRDGLAANCPPAMRCEVDLPAVRHGNAFRLSGVTRLVADGGFADRPLVPWRAGVGLTPFDLPADRAGITLDDVAAQVAEMAVPPATTRATATGRRAVQRGVQMPGGIGMAGALDMKRARVGAQWLGDRGHCAACVARQRGF